jgi:plastocyanin
MNGRHAFGQVTSVFAIVAASLAASRCTPGALSQAAGPGTAAAGTAVIEVSLVQFGSAQTRYGTVGGYSPDPLVIRAGTVIQFHNRDSFAHTATLIGTSGFPLSNPLSAAALAPSGRDVAASWSTGDLNAGAFSQTLTASRPGVFYYGCQHHYGSPMRGLIIVQ